VRRRLQELPTLVRAALDHGATHAPHSVNRAIVAQFHRLFYHSSQARLETMTWMGTPINKCPMDLWIYQELLHRVRPAVVVETGTAWGGSALYFAGLCDLLNHGRIVTIDIGVAEGRPEHPRITHIVGSSTAPEIVDEVRRLVRDDAPVLITLDSDHSYSHVRDELAAYADLVTPGSYLVVEDTNLNGHPVHPRFGPGPMEAVQEFLAADCRFEADRECEKFFMSYNPGGYLRQVA
jgi:cephalosporin hydroxylase